MRSLVSECYNEWEKLIRWFKKRETLFLHKRFVYLYPLQI